MLLEPRTAGDTAFPPTFTCLADGAGVDLTGSTVTLELHFGTTVKTPAITVLNQGTSPGKLQPNFAPEDVDMPGNWEALVHVVGTDGLRATFRGVYVPIVED
jgi:hypothetical protein